MCVTRSCQMRPSRCRAGCTFWPGRTEDQERPAHMATRNRYIHCNESLQVSSLLVCGVPRHWQGDVGFHAGRQLPACFERQLRRIQPANRSGPGRMCCSNNAEALVADTPPIRHARWRLLQSGHPVRTGPGLLFRVPLQILTIYLQRLGAYNSDTPRHGPQKEMV
jgi:hypothetical protein